MAKIDLHISWLIEKAELEHNSFLSVGGLVSILCTTPETPFGSELPPPAEEATIPKTQSPHSNADLDWLISRATIENGAFLSVAGLVSLLNSQQDTASAPKISPNEAESPSLKETLQTNELAERWLLDHAAIENSSFISVGGLPYALAQTLDIEWKSLTSSPDAPISSVREHLRNLRTFISFSEGLLPEQKCNLRDDFVPPVLINLDDPTKPTPSFDEFLDQRHSIVILGEPGCGKTSLLRYLALSLADTAETRVPHRIPVYLSLREWVPNRSFQGFLNSSLERVGILRLLVHYSAPRSVGSLVFFFDGADEVLDENRLELLAGIQQAATTDPRCQIFVTARNKQTVESLRGFTRYAIAPLSQNQMFHVVRTKLRQQSVANAFWESLQEEPDLRSTASNVFLLTLLTTRFARNDLSPQDITNVYARIVYALVDEWDAVRGIVRSRQLWSAPDVKLTVLKRIASELLLRNCDTFTTEDFVQWIERLVGPHDHSQLLEALAEHTGLLRRSPQSCWEFSHLVYRDYFAAMFYGEKYARNSALQRDPTSAVTNRRILRFVCGKSSDATELVSMIIGQRSSQNSESAIVLAEALSQSLSIDRSTVEYVCSYIVNNLHDLLTWEGTHENRVTKRSVTEEGSYYELLYPETESESGRVATSVAALFNALSRARKGVAKSILAEAMCKSQLEILQTLGRSLRKGLRISTTLSEEKTQLLIQCPNVATEDPVD